MAEGELRWEGVRRPRLQYIVERLHDPDQVRVLLRPRVEYTAYALGQLEPGLVERARWYWARGDTGTGVVVHSRGGLGEAMLVAGDPDAVAAILSLHPGPAQTYATFQPQHGGGMRAVYRLSNHLPMIRMSVEREAFRPVTGETVALSGLDIRKINALYASEGGSAYYAPEHIDAGLYRGVIAGSQLVSIAGTHVISRQERVAVVGNVFTHPAHRGRGFATLATSAVTAQLFEACDHIVLTVDPNNHPAIAAYERLGYREVCQLIEASAQRRDLTGLSSAVRRLRGLARGRRYGGWFVSRRP